MHTKMLMEPHYVSLRMRAVLLNELYHMVATAVGRRRTCYDTPRHGFITHHTMLNAIALMDAVFPLATDRDTGAIRWRAEPARPKPPPAGTTRTHRPRTLRAAAGSTTKPDASAPEIRDHEFKLLLEMCLQTALAMGSDALFKDYATDCMVRPWDVDSAWHRGTIRRDVVIRAANLVGSAYSRPRVGVAHTNRPACSEPGGGTCSCAAADKAPFRVQAPEGPPLDAFRIEHGHLAAAAQNKRCLFEEPPLWTFAFLTLLAIDPSFNLHRNISLPCVRCREMFHIPQLRTLQTCLTQVSITSIPAIMDGLRDTCRWVRSGTSVQLAMHAAGCIH